MIAPLRRLHRIVFVLAALLLPLLLMLALRARRPMPLNEPLPAALVVPETPAPEAVP